jgi:hypothetical protein
VRLQFRARRKTARISPSLFMRLHAIPFRTKDDSEAAVAKVVIKDATGCQELHDYLHAFREAKDSL